MRPVDDCCSQLNLTRGPKNEEKMIITKNKKESTGLIGSAGLTILTFKW